MSFAPGMVSVDSCSVKRNKAVDRKKRGCTVIERTEGGNGLRTCQPF
jgi:hypothetical protein